MGEADIRAALGEAADKAVEVAFLVFGKGDSQSDVLSDDVFERDVAFSGEQLEIEAEQTRDALFPLEALQKKHVVAQGRIDRDQPILLCVGHKFAAARRFLAPEVIVRWIAKTFGDHSTRQIL